jgi:glycosyltransferase involved in cell wall biosynthesis
VSFVDPPRSALGARVVVAAGKLGRRKGFDRLLLAWEQVVGRHPEWRLEIFGSGRLQPAIEAQIAELGLSGSVRLRGYTERMPTELARASVLAMTSRNEGFPMLLLEAMSAGVPVVAYDCPTGPRDIVTDGVDGYVVPNGRTRLFADALSSLMDDAERRRRMGAAALEKVSDYEVAAIGARWEALFDELAAAKSAGATSRGRGAATARARG